MVKTGKCVCLFAWVRCVAALLLSIGVGACVLVQGFRQRSKSEVQQAMYLSRC